MTNPDPRESMREFVKSFKQAVMDVRYMVAANVDGLTGDQVKQIQWIIDIALDTAHKSAFMDGYNKGFEAGLEAAEKFATEHGWSDAAKMRSLPLNLAHADLPPVKIS